MEIAPTFSFFGGVRLLMVNPPIILWLSGSLGFRGVLGSDLAIPLERDPAKSWRTSYPKRNARCHPERSEGSLPSTAQLRPTLRAELRFILDARAAVNTNMPLGQRLSTGRAELGPGLNHRTTLRTGCL